MHSDLLPNSRQPAIHQFVAGFAEGDAITNAARVLRDLFRAWGYVSDIFSESRRILPELRSEAHDVAEYIRIAQPEHVLLLHLSIGSPVNEHVATLPGRKAILYHNITPPAYFQAIQPEVARALEHGQRQVRELAGVAAVNLAVSRFNAEELTRLGYRNVQTVPLPLPLDQLRIPPDRRVLRQFQDGLVNVLFVGRCAPNKRIEDALSAFCWFHRYVEPQSRFIHVGSYHGTERYYALLTALSRQAGLHTVHFCGSVPQSSLNAYYRSAHLFICMSEHEGVCAPLLECMATDVPVLAFAAAAVPETLDGAGVLFYEKRYDWIAETMGLLVRDAHLRAAVLNGQRARLQRYQAQDIGVRFREVLAPILPAL